MIQQAIRDFLMLLVTIDPIGTLAIFVPITSAVSHHEKARIARRAVIYGGLVLIGFLIAGQLLLSGIGVRLVSFQLAGGVILFLFGLQMVFGTVTAGGAEPGHDVAVFPLALPVIANPGSILAVVLLTDNHRQSIAQQALTGAVLLVVLAITLVTLLLAQPIHRVLGSTGSNVLVRVMGLLLAALAAEQIVAGVEQLIGRPAPA
ncbi:MAG TPA: MarC family protein [Thermoanaerobaculia bacterium]|nr:MarC family protein [Thermoanaerobaculia bacterium]